MSSAVEIIAFWQKELQLKLFCICFYLDTGILLPVKNGTVISLKSFCCNLCSTNLYLLDMIQNFSEYSLFGHLKTRLLVHLLRYYNSILLSLTKLPYQDDDFIIFTRLRRRWSSRFRCISDLTRKFQYFSFGDSGLLRLCFRIKCFGAFAGPFLSWSDADNRCRRWCNCCSCWWRWKKILRADCGLSQYCSEYSRTILESFGDVQLFRPNGHVPW